MSKILINCFKVMNVSNWFVGAFIFKKKSSWKNIFKRNPQKEALGYDEICGYELE